jgi:hypothetical protein
VSTLRVAAICLLAALLVDCREMVSAIGPPY